MPQSHSTLTRIASLALCTLFSSALYGQAGTAARTMIPSGASLTQRTTLAGSVRAVARDARYDRGALAPETQLTQVFITLKRSPEREAALEEYLGAVNDETSPVYHKWLTPKQLHNDYGAAPEDVARVTTWLESQGLRVDQVYATGTGIAVSGPARAFDAAFHAGMHRLVVNGQEHVANTAELQIPAAFAGVIEGVASLSDFHPHPLHHNKVVNHIAENGLVNPDYTVSSSYRLVTPGDLKIIYNLQQVFNAGFTGQGQTIGLIEDTDLYANSDWTTFRSTFGLSGYTKGSLTTNHPAPASGGTACPDPGVNGNDGEAILDAEYASAAAPSAAIVMETCADGTGDGILAALQNLSATGTSPKILSISYGEDEASNGASSNLAYKNVYQALAAQGVSVFVSSGDSGADVADQNASAATHGINVSGLSSTIYNVSVGGTDYSDLAHGTQNTYWSTTNNADYSSALSYIEEMPWDDSCANRILSKALGYTTTYGSSGGCNSATGEKYYLNTGGGSGGPSGCATGVANTDSVVSGTCAGYAKPAFQGVVANGTFTGVLGVPNDGVRDQPDVSLFAANGVWGHYYPFCYTDPNYGGTSCSGAPSSWSGAGGTSFASPIFAAMQSLVNQVTGSTWGNPLPTYYNLAAQQFGTTGNDSCNSIYGGRVSGNCAFHDVTIGDNDVNCTGTVNCYTPSGVNGVLSLSNTSYLPAYRSNPGWDFTSGIGTPNVGALINRWNTVSHSTPRYQ